MFDLQALGTQLVKELSALIEQSVIVTDKNGFIIASSDPERVNTYHEGASIAMKTRKELMMTEEMTTKLQGVRPGIVLPIVVSDTSIGVIGITGVPAEIEKYAKLVRKVAELFVAEFLVRQERERGYRDLELLIFDWFSTDLDEETIAERAKWLGLNIAEFTRVAVIEAKNAFDLTDVEDLLRSQRVHPGVKLIRWGVGKLVMLIPEIPETFLRTKMIELEQVINRSIPAVNGIGVGGKKPYNLLRDSFRGAERAAKVSAKWSRVVIEEELKLELLYYSMSGEIKEEFTKRTILPLFEEPELYETLKVWLAHTGSLQEIADKLHIHKNTLKYRLQKIEQLLNLDFNNKEHIAIIAVAVGLLAAK